MAAASALSAEEFTLWDGGKAADIYVDRSEPEFVRLAVKDLVSDAAKIGPAELKLAASPDKNTPTLYIGTCDNKKFSDAIKALGASAESLKGKRECFMMQNAGGNSFVIAGSDPRGTMFGVYDFIEKYLGVQPLYFFSGLEPKKKNKVALRDISHKSAEPTVKYRGWFINDEDLLSEFYPAEGYRNIDYAFYRQVVNPKLMARIAEALVRAKFNLIIPASFLDIENPSEAALVKEAAKRGIYISMHHIEPLGVSGYTFQNYWRAKGENDTPFSYFSAKEKMEETWRHYAKKWSGVPNVIWQIGLRGVGDRPMWFADGKIPDSDKQRGKIISEAIAAQSAIIREFDRRENPPMTATLWAEGAVLHEKGFLKIPQGTTIVFSDNCPGWKMQNDFEKIERMPEYKYGIYYHHQLWGCGPHMAHAVPPSQTAKVLKEALDKSSTDYVVMNVSNVREFVVGIETSAKALFDLNSVKPDGGLSDFMSEHFPEHGQAMAAAYEKYYRCFSMHPSRKVPFWLDGNCRNEALANFSQIRKASASKKSLAAYLKNERKGGGENKKQTEMKRFVFVMLGDAYPDKGSYEFRLAHIAKQAGDFKKASEEIRSLSESLPKRERDFLRANLLSHSLVMLGFSEICKFSVEARIAFNKEEFEKCLSLLNSARNSLKHIREGMEINTQGKWKNWYRGDRKMNVADFENRLGSTMQSLQKLISQIENKR